MSFCLVKEKGQKSIQQECMHSSRMRTDRNSGHLGEGGEVAWKCVQCPYKKDFSLQYFLKFLAYKNKTFKKFWKMGEILENQGILSVQKSGNYEIERIYWVNKQRVVPARLCMMKVWKCYVHH